VDPEPLEAKAASPGRSWLGYVLAAGSLVWVFHDVSIASLWSEIRVMKPGWIVAAVGVDIVAYLAQGWRWHRLLLVVGNVGPMETTKATYAGLYVNEILPLRLGEFLRIRLVAQRLGDAYHSVVSSVIVERFIDAVWLAAAFGLVVLSTPLPGYLVDAEGVLAAVVFGGLTAFVVLAAVSRGRVKLGAPASNNRLIRMLRPLGESLVLIGRSSSFASAFLGSSAVLACQALAYYFVGLSYGLTLTFWQVMAAYLVLHVGNVVPSAPGNLGTYQLFAVLGLTTFGVSKTSATGFSIVVFLILTIPLWAIGSVCFARSGLELSSIRSKLGDWREQGAERELRK